MSKVRWFEKTKAELKLVFVDCETHFSDVGTPRNTWKYKTPILRLLTWMTWDGQTTSKPVTRDARFFDGDPWQDIRELLEQGYILIAYNTQFDIQPALCSGGWILPFIFKGQVLDVMTNEIILSGYNGLCKPYNKFEIEKSMAEISGEDFEEEEGSAEDEEGEIKNIGGQFRLADCAWLYCGIKLDKRWQHPDTYYNDIIDPEALEYASEDVEVLAPIFFKQLELISQKNCGDAIALKTELLATGYIYENYGIPVNIEKLNKLRVKYSNLAEDQKEELLAVLPKVMPSRTDCMKAFKSNFEKVKGAKGLYSFNGEAVALKSMADLEKSIGDYYKSPHREPNEHVMRFHNFLRNNKELLERPPNLGYSSDLKQAFKKLGYEIDSADKFAMSKLALVDDVVEAIKLREYRKSLTLLKGAFSSITYGKFLNSDNTLRPKAQWNASVNFRAAMKDPNCYSADTEILTNKGWKPIIDITYDDLIANYWHGGGVTFSKPLNIIEKVNKDDLLHISNNHVDLMVTEDHRCLLKNRQSRKYFDKLAKDYLKDGLSIHGGNYNLEKADTRSSKYQEALIKFLVAYQADGSFGARRFDFSFSKQRKFNRLIEILDSMQVTYEIGKSKNLGRFRIYVDKTEALLRDMSELIHLNNNKTFNENILELPNSSRKIFLDELEFWDGHRGKNSILGFTYFSTNERNIDYVQALCALDSRRTLKRLVRVAGIETRSNGDVRNRHNSLFNLYIFNGNESNTANTTVTKSAKELHPKVYCLSVESTYVIVRRDGKVTVSGNCLSLPRAMKDVLSCPAGMLAMTFDFSAVELQYLLDKYRPPEALKLLDAEDQHLFCASRYFERDYETLLKKKHEGDKEIKEIRNLSKKTTYFGIYKSNANPKSKFITGTNKLIESIRTDLNININKDQAKKLILNSQKFFSTWSDTKDQVEKWIMSKYRGGHKFVTFTSDKLNFKSNFMIEKLYNAEDDYTNPRSLLSCMIGGNVTIGTQYALNRVQEHLLSKYSPDEIRLNLYWHDSYTIFGKPDILFKEKDTILEMLCKYTFEYSGMSSTFLEIAGNIYDKDGNLYNSPTDIVKTEIRVENEKEVTYYYDEFNDNWTKELEERYRYDKFGNFARLG